MTYTSPEGVSISRASHYIPKSSNLITRILYEVSLLKNMFKVSKSVSASSMDLVVTIGSSFTGHYLGKKLAKRKSIPLVVVIHDLIGKGLVQSGIPGGKFIANVVQRLEFSTLKHAARIAVISPAMKIALEEMGIEEKKISLIPLYSTNSIPELEKSKAKRANGWGLDSFAVVHSGNMGNKQHLETLIAAANVLNAEKEIVFYLVGHGNQEANLKQLATGMKNVHFLPPAPDEEFPNILGGADLLLVSERASQIEMSLPSKLTSYFFSNRPVIASVPLAGATAQYLEGLAHVVPAETPQLLAQEILFLKENCEYRSVLALRALDYAKVNLAKESGRKRYVDWVLDESNE
jgi:glycosyltransferase involved in cell wall biosynthesis